MCLHHSIILGYSEETCAGEGLKGPLSQPSLSLIAVQGCETVIDMYITPLSMCSGQSYMCVVVNIPPLMYVCMYLCHRSLMTMVLNSMLMIDDVYVDGLAITYDSSPHRHLWTYVSTHPEGAGCPCADSRPSFVQDHYCKSGNSAPPEGGWYIDGPL